MIWYLKSRLLLITYLTPVSTQMHYKHNYLSIHLILDPVALWHQVLKTYFLI